MISYLETTLSSALQEIRYTIFLLLYLKKKYLASIFTEFLLLIYLSLT